MFRSFESRVASVVAFAMLAWVGFAGMPAAADVIRLKSGGEIQGIIDQERTNDERVYIKTSAGLIPISRSRIESVEVREDVSSDEGLGDLAMQEGDFNRALIYYLRAYADNPENETLAGKIAEVKERIRERDARRFEAEFREINRAVMERDFEAALGKARELRSLAETESIRLRIDEKIAQIYLAQARNYRNKVNYSSAEEAYRKAIEVYPQGATAQIELAEMISSYPSRQEEAQRLYRAGISLAQADPTLIPRPELLEARYTYARLHLRSEPRKAARLFLEVMEDDHNRRFPQTYDYILQAIHALLPELTAENEANREIMDILESVIEMKPEDSRARFILGKIHADRGNCARATPILQDALENAKNTPGRSNVAEIHFLLGICYRTLKNDRMAIDHLKEVLALQPRRYDAMTELAEIYSMQLENAEAVRLFERAIEIEPAQYRAYQGLARTFRQMKEYRRALEQYLILNDLRPDYSEYYYEMGLTYTELDMHDEARLAYEKVVALLEQEDGDDPEVRRRMAEAYTQLGKTSLAQSRYYEAIDQFDKALELHPDHAPAFDGKGVAYRELTMLNQAEKWFLNAIEAEPDNPGFRLNMAVLLHKFKKEPRKALPYYYDYYSLGGTDPKVREWIREAGGTPPAPRS